MKATYLALIGALALPACMPLEQAPLVYSSKQQFGVTVSAGTPENPGFDANIGFKSLDAAFVPVMVSKHCEPNHANCGMINPNVLLAVGSSSRNSTAKLDQDRINGLRLEAAVASKAVDELSKKISEQEKLLATVKKERELRDEKTNLSTPPVATTKGDALSTADADDTARTDVATVLTPEQISLNTKRIAEINQQLSTIDGKTIESVTTARDKLTTESQTNANLAVAKKNEADKLAETLDRSSNDGKTDALSVYGSFNGGADAKSTEVSLQLGKVFSTGVAAQHLTQGIGTASSALAIAACIEHATTAVLQLPDTSRAITLRLLLDACSQDVR